MTRKIGFGSVSAALLGSAALVALNTPALAQATGGQQAGGIEEIVVTAERHTQSIMTVPAAIQAESGQQLNDAGINRLGDLQFITPGYLPSTGSGYTQVFIRGIGNSVFVGPDPSVASYVDDVPRIWGSMPDTVSDISRVEVLKGPQGGLYGRNATGGVVNMITRQPSTDGFAATTQVSYGSLNTLDAAGYINVPLTDNLAWSLSAERETHDAYVKNIAVANQWTAADFNGPTTSGGLLGFPTGLTPQQQANFLNSTDSPQHGFETGNTYTADTKLLWQASSHFKITLAGDYYNKGDTTGNQLQLTTPAYTQAYAVGTIDALTGFTANPLAGYLKTPGTFFMTEPGKWQAAFNDKQETDLHDWGGSITAVWNAPGADITSITAYRGQHTDYLVDLATSAIPFGEVDVNNEKHFFYQEVRAISTGEGPFHWLGGVTFLNDYYRGYTASQIFDFPFSPIVAMHDVIQDWTIYAQAGYDITSRLNFTASARYLHETNNANFACCDVAPATGPVSESLAEHAFIPSATLSYALDDGTLYARWARGFKAGGINPVADPTAWTTVGASLSEGSTFKPERVDTYEAGYKQSLMDHRLQLNGDIFYNKYSDLQQTAHANPAYQATVILAIANAGSADTYGAEGSINYQVIDPLTLGVNVGYLEAKYLNFTIPSTQPILAPEDLSNTVMTNSPKWQLSFTGALDQPLDDRFDLVGNIVESHISSVLYDQSLIPGVLPNAVGPGYWLTNVRLGVKTNDGKYEFVVFANNLFDQAYYTYGSSDANGNELTWGIPRIVGAQLTMNFD
ncbi:MAG: TonB-dependent receptor [Rhizomicrobium sp.]